MDGDQQHHHWEEDIDIDDSDLPSLLHPTPTHSSSSNTGTLLSLRACSQSQFPSQSQVQSRSQNEKEKKDPSPPKKTLIPGPAGSIQAAMHRRSAAAAAAATDDWKLLSDSDRQSYLMEEDEDDGDFKLNPWLSALSFLGLDRGSLRSPIVSIKNQRDPAHRIPQVVGIVKSSVPNGLGDLFITLKDPTGTIGASINRKVFLESALGGSISVGCVLVLKEVAVFSPARSASYLNVTPNNVVKVISKDCSAPDREMMHWPSFRYGTKDIEKLMDSRKSVHNGSMAVNISTTQIGNYLDVPLMRASTEHKALKTDLRANLNCVGDGPPNIDSNLDRRLDDNHHANDGTRNRAVEDDRRRAEPKQLISKASVAQWTDEQLLELFADYQDDAD